MSDRRKLPEMIELFKDEFNEDLSTMNALIEYEVLILSIEMAINDNPNDLMLGGEIRQIMSNWNGKKDNTLFRPKKTEPNYPKIELLNSEGPIIILKRTRDAFLMYDEWKFLIGKFSVESIRKFIDGKSTVTDSNERVWNYKEQPDGMKCDSQKLENFINLLR